MSENENKEQNIAAEESTAAFQNTQQEDYYAALKRIEEEKEAKAKEKKIKKGIGCGAFLLVIILLSIISSISSNIKKAETEKIINQMASEPITCLNVRDVILYAKQNGLDEGKEKYEKHENGYTYRYNCVAKVEMDLGNNVYLVSIPYYDNEKGEWYTPGLSARLKIPSNTDIGYDDRPKELEFWVTLQNVTIDVYMSNESGILVSPVIDSQAVVLVELSEEAALAWLESVNQEQK